MQNNNETTSQAITTSEEPKGQPELCVGCKKFYGSSALNNYCSSCFKAMNIQIEKKVEQVQADKIVQELPQQPKADPSRCLVCTRKLGINGYLCKCTHYYCGKHRIPEDHQCTYDHAAMAKQQLVKNNPLVEGAKIDKI